MEPFGGEALTIQSKYEPRGGSIYEYSQPENLTDFEERTSKNPVDSVNVDSCSLLILVLIWFPLLAVIKAIVRRKVDESHMSCSTSRKQHLIGGILNQR